MGSKFGISSVFNLVYLGNTQIFPTSIVATTYGVCGVFARVFTIFAPYVAEITPESVPQWIYVIICLIAAAASLRLKSSKKEEPAKGDKTENIIKNPDNKMI